ncbi:hypothetical protein [Desulforamulus ruminis]|uniref:Uncharacterized protein n=1 Tax=Desulforamulus ruminis (strain ATCC 23193 / DSM 2154 / NCIMB 8452 / DL) TaxID=696281 RepID=F6DVM4_DESRL|nr:hypothetical protein [Desulforamulus ruminis]AEG61484.1 hypothetical protein Desru_3278 [Desulforamulus ruminis DSM 2154]
MGKLYFGAPLDSIKKVFLHGFQPGDTLRGNLLGAMLDAKKGVGLNRRFKPTVLVLEAPDQPDLLQKTDHGITVVRAFNPIFIELFPVKIDFRSPHLVKVAGTLSLDVLFQADRLKAPYKKRASK